MISPYLILFRHGNTFEAGQTATWVGARTDMPLTREGEKQAEAAARYVQQHVDNVGVILAGPLQRTQRFAGIMGAAIGQNVSLDERLREIDYGLWENLSGAEISQRFGDDTLTQWQENGIWPNNMNWAPDQKELLENLRGFLREQHEQLTAMASTRLAVTSNGILRLIHRLVTGKAAGHEAKVKTGRYCVLIPAGENWAVQAWNACP